MIEYYYKLENAIQFLNLKTKNVSIQKSNKSNDDVQTDLFLEEKINKLKGDIIGKIIKENRNFLDSTLFHERNLTNSLGETSYASWKIRFYILYNIK